ncbi:MAG: ComEC/Rec2 family competence protein [Chloroflexota bacterium]
MLLTYIALAFAAGIAVASVVRLPLIVWVWWLLLPLGLLLIWRRDPLLRRAHLCLLVFLFAAIRYAAALPQFDDHALATYNDRGTLLLVGVVSDYPDVRDYATNLRVNITRVRIENVWRDVSGVALVQVPRETDARYGDQLQVFGEPATPFESEDFSYKDYLARQGIHSVVRVYGGVKILARDQGNPFFAALYAFRDRALATVYAILPDPSASLLAGILLGVDSGIPRDVRDAFSATNTAHIIAISGFNIAIVAGILAALARRVAGERRAAVIVILGLVAYTLLVGASESVVRAAIMGSLSVLALHFHRQNTALNSLAAAALLMLAWNPFTLYDLGFQLSFLATLGLILYVTPLSTAFENFFARFTSSERAKQIVGALGDSFIVTLAAQITTTPLIVFAFHRLSLVGLLTNLIVLPAQPAVMIWGGIATLVAMIVQPVGQVIAWIAWAFLEFTIVVVQATAALPFGSFQVGRFDAPILAAYYLLLFGATRIGWQTLRARIALRPALALGVALVIGMWGWNFALTAPDDKTHVVFLDGGTTLAQSPHGARVVIDGGAQPSAVLSALGQRMPFWDRAIDLLVLTDAGDDHLAALVTVLERYDVRQIVQANAPAKPTAAYLKWRDLIASKRVPVFIAQAGATITVDRDWRLEIVSTREDTASATARLRAGNLAVLFAESASADDQAALLKSGDDLTSGVLIAPRKITNDFVDAVNPQFAILFGGRTTRDKPSADLLAALARATILQTSERGTIEMIVDGNSLIVH